MEIKYKFALIAGIIAAIVMGALLFVKHKKTEDYKEGKKVVGLSRIEKSDYFNQRVFAYRLLLGVLAASFIIVVFFGFLLISKPYETERIQDEKYCRDIILCIDISTSVDYLNENLLEKLKSTVDELQGERFGIVLFNTSPVVLSPLTDDYVYIKEQLDIVAKSLKMRNASSVEYWTTDTADWLYYDAYISSGTLVGNQERGSSLIGDGLAAAAFDFSENQDDKERTKVIIFSTDNDIQGEPIVTLDEAADICVRNDVTVYGIGTKEMTATNKKNMKNAVEKTGGTFFLEEESGSFSHIVDSINSMSKSLVNVKTITKEIPKIEVPFILMLITFGVMLGVTRILNM